LAALWLGLPSLHWTAPSLDDRIAMVRQIEGTNVGLLRNYGVVQQLDLLENLDVIQHLKQLRQSRHHHAMRS
jgi:hypothetical protein